MASSGRPIEWRDKTPAEVSGSAESSNQGPLLQVELVELDKPRYNFQLADLQLELNDVLRDMKRRGKRPTAINFGECQWRGDTSDLVTRFAAISYWVDE